MTTYPATNLQLTYNNDTDKWNYTEVAYEYGDIPPPNWSGYTGEDPAFEYASDVSTQPPPTTDPCPPGYIYDETLKQCITDPNYQAPAYAREPEKSEYEKRQEAENILHIPSNETKENWIANADTVITSGEGAGKTGLQNYLDNLNDRGFTKVVDGKIIFVKNPTKHPIAQGIANILGHEEKTNKMIQDLQRMGAIDAQVSSTGIDKELSELTGKDELGIDFAPEMILSDTAFTFPTYNYKPGTEATGWRPGDYTGFTTPTTYSGPVNQYVKKGDTFKTWEDYINVITQTPTITGFQEVKKTIVPTISGPKDYPWAGSPGTTVPKPQASPTILAEERNQEIHNEKLEQAKLDTNIKREQFREQKDKYKEEKERQQRQERVEKRQEQKKEGTGGSFGRDEDRKPEPQKKERKTGQGGAPIWRL